MYVRFKGSTEAFQLVVKPIGKNLVQLWPPFPSANLTSGFEVMTKETGGKVFGDYLDYITLYRTLEDGSIILSNDGSVWVPPVYRVVFVCSGGQIIGESEQIVDDFSELIIPEVDPDEQHSFNGWSPEIPIEGKVDRNYTFYAEMEYIPSLEEVKEQKKREISAACEQTIYAGVTVNLPDGSIEHFSLKTEDQINLFGKQAQLNAGVKRLEYHQDGHPCRYYTAEEMQAIITAAMQWVSYHTTYCNSLNMWIAGARTVEEVNGIYYGADIPEEYQSEVLVDYLTAIMAEAEEAIESETMP